MNIAANVNKIDNLICLLWSFRIVDDVDIYEARVKLSEAINTDLKVTWSL